MKRLLALLLGLLTVFGAMPAFAAENEEFIIEGTKLVKYVGNGGDVVIPEGITVIGECAFMESDMVEEKTAIITSVSIPDTVTVIERGAFVNCSGLKEVYLPDSVTEVGDYAFYSAACEEIRIPEGLQNFGHYSFFAHPFWSKLMNEDGLMIINNVLVEIDADKYKYPADHTFTVPDGIEKLRLGNFGELSALVIPASCTDVGDLHNDEDFLCITKVYGVKGSPAADDLPDETVFVPFALNKTALTLAKGKTAVLKFNSGSKAVWKSDNDKIVTVSKSGKLTAKAAGTANITATLYGRKYTCKVTVSAVTMTTGKTYTVKRGDTLWSIAKKELGKGTRYTEIMKQNGLNSTLIHAGKKLYLPEE